ncbi:MAG: PCMD domain-containing protein [Bacteroidales bacterium]|nr:PCMD domain-containing protein [Bacteroidales bacterium]
MKHFLLSLTCLCALLPAFVNASAQRQELVPLGDFEQWAVRYITDAKMLGGEQHALYMVAPTDTIVGNCTFDYSNTIWGTSNAYAVIMGMTKTSCSTTPDQGPHGTCAKLESTFATCKAAGMINIKVIAQGSIFWGDPIEPITSTNASYEFMDWGIPFTGHPTAFVMDYKALIPNTGQVYNKKAKLVEGYDEAEVIFLLQNRTEDAQGNIHSVRVGTAMMRIGKSTDGWIFDYHIPVIYGDVTKSPLCKPYMGFMTGERTLYARNSKGVNKPILEESWGNADTPVTHAVLFIESGSLGAYTGALGNTLWLDNIRLEYAQ